MKRIVVIGEILVEIMADTTGDGFGGPIALTGPYPSGAPAIFIDQVARLGQPCGIVSAVGDDDFGRLNIERLKRDGVDTSAIHLSTDRPTGTAFVRYRDTGERDFVFNIEHSACGQIRQSAASDAMVDGADHLHVMGSSLTSEAMIALNLDAAARIKSRGGTVSFDPNLRKEMLGDPKMRQAMKDVLASTDVFLPSGDEMALLTQSSDKTGALSEIFDLGVAAVVHKQGAQGAIHYEPQRAVAVSGIKVEEIDPTGAGDCFGGAFVTFWLRGLEPEQALRRAAAAGALAVTVRGPMEGAATLDQIEALLANRTDPDT